MCPQAPAIKLVITTRGNVSFRPQAVVCQTRLRTSIPLTRPVRHVEDDAAYLQEETLKAHRKGISAGTISRDDQHGDRQSHRGGGRGALIAGPDVIEASR